MKSVADELRIDLLARVAAMSTDERLELIAQLAEDDLAAFQAASGLSRSQARCELLRRRQSGRRFSRVAGSFIDDSMSRP